jgi:phosphoenolpyruvate carboxykinase (ATP)
MIFHNLSINGLYSHTKDNTCYRVTSTGALLAYSGKYTGRCPKDKRISCCDKTKNDIWWGDVNIEIKKELLKECYDKGLKHIFSKKHIYVIDSYAGWDNRKDGKQINIRTICTDPYHALFIRNMLILTDKPHKPQNIDLTVVNCGDITTRECGIQDNSINENLVGMDIDDGRVIIYGTKYAGEMKKAVLTYVMHVMPKYNYLPLHSSACVNEHGDTLMFFGLSGTGKTT